MIKEGILRMISLFLFILIPFFALGVIIDFFISIINNVDFNMTGVYFLVGDILVLIAIKIHNIFDM